MKPEPLISFTTRAGMLFGFWLLLLQPHSVALSAMGADWAVGALAAAGTARLSLRLLPPRRRLPRAWPLLKFLARFGVQSLLGGVEVARRALDPRPGRMKPGLIHYPTSLHSESRRALFGALTSQVPGTLAVGSGQMNDMTYHCLSPNEAIARGLATDEALFMDVFGADEVARRELAS